MRQIAAGLGCCTATVTALIRDWHEAGGLAAPDGRVRRKSLGFKGRPRGTPGE